MIVVNGVIHYPEMLGRIWLLPDPAIPQLESTAGWSATPIGQRLLLEAPIDHAVWDAVMERRL